MNWDEFKVIFSITSNNSSLKNTKTNFKFRKPFFSPLNQIPKEIEEKSQEFLKKWIEQRTLSPPKRRSFHTSCIYNDYLYIFGGKDITEGKLSDIIRINLDTTNIFLCSLISPFIKRRISRLEYRR